MPLDTQDLRNIHSVGVYSGLGDRLQNTYVGTTIFTNENDVKNVREWNIDTFTESVMVHTLERNPSFQRVGLVNVQGGRRPFVDGNRSALSTVLNAARAQGFDTLVIVSPVAYANDSQVRAGYGLHAQNRFLGTVKSSDVYVQSNFNVYDTKTEKSIAISWGFDVSRVKGAYARLPVAWKENFNHYSSTEKVAIERAIKGKIDQSVKYALKQLNLVH